MRISAKELTSLILDEERLRAERADRKSWKSRVTGIEEYGGGSHGGGGGGGGSSENHGRSRQPPQRRRENNNNDEDLEFRLALEASKNEAEEDRKRRERNSTVPDDDDDLAKAIKLSKEEEELRRRELESSNTDLLFGDAPAQPAAYQPTGNNQGYDQQPAVDWLGNPIQQGQQSQNTGLLNNAYANPTGFGNQQTGFSNGYDAFGQQQQQQQPSVFDQFGQQAQFMQPQQTVQPQHTAFNMNNPYSGFAPSPFDNLGQQQQQQPQQQQQFQ